MIRVRFYASCLVHKAQGSIYFLMTSVPLHLKVLATGWSAIKERLNCTISEITPKSCHSTSRYIIVISLDIASWELLEVLNSSCSQFWRWRVARKIHYKMGIIFGILELGWIRENSSKKYFSTLKKLIFLGHTLKKKKNYTLITLVRSRGNPVTF